MMRAPPPFVAIVCAAAAIVMSCLPAASESDAVDVRIELLKNEYRVGEPISFSVTSNRSCYFLVYTIDPAGKVEVHDPDVSGAYMGAPLLRQDEHRQIPIPGSPGRAIVTEPHGDYQIGAVCSREELSKLGLTQIELKEPARRGRRNFEFHLQEKLEKVDRESAARTSASYHVSR